jgi:gamma-glutamyl-gamma-aminobutyrate hydrolase PuuD
MPIRFAITQNVEVFPGVRDTLNHNYLAYFQGLGIELVLVPNAATDPCLYLDSFGVDGVIFTGGNNIGPKLYGSETNAVENISEDRDRTEIKLLQRCVERRLKVLGICRGFQLINAFFGGAVVRDLSGQAGEVINHAGSSHLISVIDSNIVSAFGVQEFLCNSFHRQGVIPCYLAPNLKPFAVSTGDGVIEGVLHPNYPIVGIQWHPERGGGSQEFDCSLMASFLRNDLWKDRC